jgi:hypothetical protein
MSKKISIILGFFILSNLCVFGEDTSTLTAPAIEVTWVGTSTIDTLPEYVPSWTEVLVGVRLNGGIDPVAGIDGDPDTPDDGQIAPAGVVLHWQLNSQNANVFMRSMSIAYNLLYQDYRYLKRIEPYGSGTKIYWWVTAQNVNGEISSTEVDSFLLGTLALDNEPLPSVFKISGNYPNPFNPKTTIDFSVKYAVEVDLSIYSLGGKLVRQLQLGALTSGNQSIAWEGKDNFGNDVPSGVYIYRLQSESHSEARKMTLLK